MPLAAVENALADRPEVRAAALLAMPEDQWLERKSVRLKSQKLAESLIAMANADGGCVVVGLSDGEVEDVEANPHHLNELMQAAVDHTDPTVRTSGKLVGCDDAAGRRVNLLVFQVKPSEQIHRTRAGKCFLRVGDETRALRPEEATELAFDKGAAKFETTRVPGVEKDELDASLLSNYANRLGKSPWLVLADRTLSNDKNGYTVAGVLLFLKNPQKYFLNAVIRVSRFKGTTREAGRDQNLISDQMIDGPIPRAIMAARTAIDQVQPTRRALTRDGVFADVPTVPADAWLEGLVNAVVHRSYSLDGDHIHVDVFDDRIEIFSPGRFPHIVDLVDPLAIQRFARNPRIVRVCFDMKLVQEMGEGIKRIYKEMRAARLQDPLYVQTLEGVTLTLSAQPMNDELDRRFPRGIREIVLVLRDRQRMSTSEVAEAIGMSRPVTRKRLEALQDNDIVGWYGKSMKDPRAYWYLVGEHEPPLTSLDT